jgi:hypothetical protein
MLERGAIHGACSGIAEERADDGTRTHGLLHGKRVVGSGVKVAEAVRLSGNWRPGAHGGRLRDHARLQATPGALGTRASSVPITRRKAPARPERPPISARTPSTISARPSSADASGRTWRR